LLLSKHERPIRYAGETVVSLEDMDNGQTQEFTKSLVPIVNQDSKTVLEILASRVDEKEVRGFKPPPPCFFFFLDGRGLWMAVLSARLQVWSGVIQCHSGHAAWPFVYYERRSKDRYKKETNAFF
jgi:hypothetical protein